MGNENAEFVILLGEDESTGAPDSSESNAKPECRIDLGSESTIESVSALFKELQVVIDEEHSVDIDAGKVKQIDTASLQLLLAFYFNREARSLKTQFVNASKAFLEVYELLGLHKILKV